MKLKYILMLLLANTIEAMASQNKEALNALAAVRKIQEIIADYAAEWKFNRQPSHISENMVRLHRPLLVTGEQKKTQHTDDGVISLDFSPDGKFLASGLQNSRIKIWDIDNKKCIQELEHTDSENKKLQNTIFVAVKYSPYKDLLASALHFEGINGRIYLWSLKENKIISELITDPVLSMSFSYDGKYLAFITIYTHSVSVINLESEPKKAFEITPLHDNQINMVTFSKNYLASCDNGCNLKVWRLENDKGICEKSFSLKGKESENLIYLDISPCEKFIALCGGRAGDRGSLKIVNLATGAIKEFNNNANTVFCVKFSKDSQQLYSTDSTDLKIWDINTGNCIQSLGDSKLKLHFDNLAISPDGTRLATGQIDGIINVWINTRNRLLRNKDLKEIFLGFKPCNFCLKNESTKKCACKEVYYCSQDCQRQDWVNHSASCTYRRS